MGNLADGVYRGRFAPSPTGPLHFGSLLAAVASYLQARVSNGVWLVRMEDLDTPREVPGAAADILHTLERYGFEWDEAVIYQSRRHDAYQYALHQLRQQGLLFPCQCSRKHLRAQMQQLGITVYPGNCRQRDFSSNTIQQDDQNAIRIRVTDVDIAFNDRVFGHHQQSLATSVGDFVLKRSDGLFAYQLAVVVDDAEQQITEILRGCDLLDNTPRQIYLQQQLGYPTPDYVHIPIATNLQGNKLSKQTFAPAIDSNAPVPALCQAMAFLGHPTPDNLQHASLADFWQWAMTHWQLSRIPALPDKVYAE